MVFDLSKYKTQSTGKIQIEFDGEAIEGAAVILHGQITKEYQDAVSTFFADLKKAEIDLGLDKEQLESASYDLQTALLVAVTTEIQGVAIGDELVGGNKGMIKQIYEEKGYLWLRGQVVTRVFSAKTFLSDPEPIKKSKKNS